MLHSKSPKTFARTPPRLALLATIMAKSRRVKRCRDNLVKDMIIRTDVGDVEQLSGCIGQGCPCTGIGCQSSERDVNVAIAMKHSVFFYSRVCDGILVYLVEADKVVKRCTGERELRRCMRRALTRSPK